MNREILFRGKSVDTGRWVEGYLVSLNDYLDESKHFSIIVPTDATLFPHGEISSYEVVIPETVGQYTGFLDKNGKKIFEGDIMRNAGNDVVFCNGSFCVAGDTPLCFWTRCEVIGNVHDNP